MGSRSCSNLERCFGAEDLIPEANGHTQVRGRGAEVVAMMPLADAFTPLGASGAMVCVPVVDLIGRVTGGESGGR